LPVNCLCTPYHKYEEIILPNKEVSINSVSLPGTGDVTTLDALGLVKTPKAWLGHVEGGDWNRRWLLRRTIAVGHHWHRSRSSSRGRRVTSRRLGDGGSGSGGLHVRHGSPQPVKLLGKKVKSAKLVGKKVKCTRSLRDWDLNSIVDKS